jgi:hypothetical protein
MRSWPVGGLGLVLRDERSQLKSKPNEAGPVNPAAGGSCPPPVPVHAVSTATRMAVAAHERDRHRNGGALVFMGISKPVGAAGSRNVGGTRTSGGQTGQTSATPECVTESSLVLVVAASSLVACVLPARVETTPAGPLRPRPGQRLPRNALLRSPGR